MKHAAEFQPLPDPADQQGGAAPEERPRGALLGPSGIASEAPASREEVRCDRLLAMVFHELRNPLCTALQSVLLLKRAPAGGEQSRHAIEVLERQLGLLGRLVEDLLDVSRMQQDKLRLERIVLDLVEVARGAVDDHRADLAARGIELAAELPDAPLWIRGDGGRLTQALGNLFANAAKFTPRGGRVELRLEADDGAQTARLRLRDTGVGFAPALREVIFEPFRQAATTVGRSGGGLGLGLAVARRVVQLHGGSIEAWSDGPGRGAEFAVHLPLEPASQRALRASGPAGAP